MKSIFVHSCLRPLTILALLTLSGCSSNLVKDDTRYNNAGLAHCSGSEWTDDSTLAVLPIPVVAFLMPHIDMNDIKTVS